MLPNGGTPNSALMRLAFALTSAVRSSVGSIEATDNLEIEVTDIHMALRTRDSSFPRLVTDSNRTEEAGNVAQVHASLQF